MQRLVIILVLSVFCLNHANADSQKNANSQKIKELELNFKKSTLGIPCWEKTIAASNELLNYKPDHAEAHFRKGIALAKLGSYKEAIDSFDLAIKYHHLGKKLSSMILNHSYYERGQCLALLDRLEEALESYDLGIKHGFDHRYIYFLRDDVLMKLGRFGEDFDQ